MHPETPTWTPDLPEDANDQTRDGRLTETNKVNSLENDPLRIQNSEGTQVDATQSLIIESEVPTKLFSDTKEGRLERFTEIKEWVQKNELPAVQTMEELFEIVGAVFGLTPEDCCDGVDEVALAEKRPEKSEPLDRGASRGKRKDTYSDGTCSLTKPHGSEFTILGMHYSDPGGPGRTEPIRINPDEQGGVRVMKFRVGIEPGSNFIRERFALVFAKMAGMEDFVPPVVITYDNNGDVGSRTLWRQDMESVVAQEGLQLFHDIHEANPEEAQELVDLAILHLLLNDADHSRNTGNFLKKPGEDRPILSIDHALIGAAPENIIYTPDVDNHGRRQRVQSLVGPDRFGQEIPVNQSSIFLQKLHGISLTEGTLRKLEHLNEMLNKENNEFVHEREQLERFIIALVPQEKMEWYNWSDWMRQVIQALLRKKTLLSYEDLRTYEDPEQILLPPSRNVEELKERYPFGKFFPRFMREKERALTWMR